MKRLILVMSIFFLMVQLVLAADIYYIRPRGHDGNCNGSVNVDDSVGVRPNCAIQTVAHGRDIYQPGDTLSLLAGSIFRECGNPIAAWQTGGTYTSNGSTATLGKPQLRCSTLVHGTVGAETVTATWTLEGGAIYSTPVASIRDANTAWLDTDTPLVKGANASLAVAGTFFPDTVGEKLYVWLPASDSPSSHVVEISKNTTVIWMQVNTTLNDLWILHADQGSSLWAGVEVIATAITAGAITNCTIGPTGGAGVYLYGDADHSITGFTISGNKFYGNWNGGTYGVDGQGVGLFVDGTGTPGFVSGVTVSKNEFGPNNFTDIRVSWASDTAIKHNLLYGHKVNGIDVSAGISGHPTIIYNNSGTHAPANGENGHWIALQVGGNYVTAKNNAAVLTGTAGTGSSVHLIYAAAGSITGHDIDYNNWYLAAGSVGHLGQWNGGTNRDTLANWQSDSSQDANSKETNPLFASLSTPSFILQPGSPAINAGTPVTGLHTVPCTDFEGRNCRDSNPDIGAYNSLQNVILGSGPAWTISGGGSLWTLQ